MILIGLAGADRAKREAVAQAMADSGLCRVLAYACLTPGLGKTWAAEQRTDKLRAFVAVTPARAAECLVLSHVITEEEAAYLRSLGGRMAHVEGRPSDLVPIRRGDLLVTATPGGHRHFLDGQEALSSLLVGEAEEGVA